MKNIQEKSFLQWVFYFENISGTMILVDALQPVWCPSDFEWKLDNGKSTIKWYDG